MANQKAESSNSGVKSTLSTPLGINIKLDGTNYLLWSTTFERYVGSHGKKHNLTKSEKRIEDWDADNDWVASAMLNSMAESVANQVMTYKSAKTTWELKALLADSERRKMIRKLSEANQYNRFLKRQLHVEEDALTQFKNELAVLELELQALVDLAEEVANSVVTATSRKINGKYIQSHLLARLEAVHEKIKKQIEDVDALKFQEITVFWVGMAENVQVMGSFDGWTEGEEMSPEYNGEFARFSATLKLRPGRYEIKFLVDGEWHLSPEFPTIGEGMMMNNLLVVE